MKLHFESLLPHINTSALNYYTYLHILAYIEMFIGFKQVHDYDYHSYTNKSTEKCSDAHK